MNNVYIMSANRSAIGGFGGTLKNHCPVDLGTLVAKEASFATKVPRSTGQWFLRVPPNPPIADLFADIM